VIECESEKLAKEILLSLVSQYGELNDQGLYEYVETAGIDYESLAKDYVLDYHGVNLESFLESYQLDENETQKPHEGYMLEICFPSEDEMNKIHDDLLSQGYIVRKK
jgi:hypothetical protein